MQKNILSVDLESWVHFYKDALKLEGYGITSSDRKTLDNNYIPNTTRNILSLLEKYNQKATFFVVGEIYDWYPETIKDIEKDRHEIGFHTQTHEILKDDKVFENEFGQSKDFIEELGITGFRAPQIFITNDLLLRLKEFGFKYSSSSYDSYKITNFDGISEIPVSALSFRNKNDHDNKLPKHLSMSMLFKKIPFGSGLFIALLGSNISYFINRLNNDNMPAILFIHPWQLYQPKEIRNFIFGLKLLYRNPLCIPYTRNILKSVEILLKRHKFASFREYYIL